MTISINFGKVDTTSNYPPYNLIQLNNVESLLEIALAGFNKKEIKVYTEYGRLIVEGNKEDTKDAEYVHRGLAFKETSAELGHYQKIQKSERFNLKMDFLPLSWVKVVPEHHARKIIYKKY